MVKTDSFPVVWGYLPEPFDFHHVPYGIEHSPNPGVLGFYTRPLMKFKPRSQKHKQLQKSMQSTRHEILSPRNATCMVDTACCSAC